MPSPITHRTQAGTAAYDDRGLTLRARFGRQALYLPWTAIDFLSPTPALRATASGWTDFRGRPVGALERLHIEPALFDRSVLAGGGWARRLWLRRLEPGVLLDADERPTPRGGFLRSGVRLTTLSVPRPVFFDFLAARSRFDLIVHNW